MSATLEHAPNPMARSRRLPSNSVLPLFAAALLAAAGCAATVEAAGETSEESAEETSETSARAAADPALAALRGGAYATPETVGGFSVEGVGVFLTAVDDAAELTVYVVAPAERATFDRPTMYLTVQEGDHSMTEVAEFDDVTLEAGESRVFRKEAQGPLMGVFADFAGE